MPNPDQQSQAVATHYRKKPVVKVPRAFPYCVVGFDTVKHHLGMTLRDWFAGQALAALGHSDEILATSATAKRAFGVANAMLAERENAATPPSLPSLELVIAVTADAANAFARELGIPECTEPFQEFTLRDLINRLWVCSSKRLAKDKREGETDADV